MMLRSNQTTKKTNMACSFRAQQEMASYGTILKRTEQFWVNHFLGCIGRVIFKKWKYLKLLFIWKCSKEGSSRLVKTGTNHIMVIFMIFYTEYILKILNNINLNPNNPWAEILNFLYNLFITDLGYTTILP